MNSDVRSGLDPSRHCYYHGTVVGDPHSWVAIDTCHGFSGVVHGHEETFAITPDMIEDETPQPAEEGQQRETERRTSGTQSALRHMHSMSTSVHEQHEKLTHDHIVYRLEDYHPLRSTCGVTPDAERAHLLHQQSIQSAQALKSDPSKVGTPLEPGSKPGDRKFVELLIVNDHARFKIHGPNTEHDSLSLSG